MFFVGQRVSCTNDRNWPTPRDFGDYSPILPVRGRVYTVRAILRRPEWDEGGLHLVEIVNPVRLRRSRAFELAFRQSRFRPLRATNIDLFLEMLEPAPEPMRIELINIASVAEPI
jgi:hypothetical protein